MGTGQQVEVYFTAIDETSKALLVTDGQHKVWLPKSQISVQRIRGRNDSDMTVRMPLWLAKKTGMVEKH